MDSPRNRHNGSFEGVQADGRLHLPANVTTMMAEDLRIALVLAADHEEAIHIDASETQSIGQAALQLLVAAKLEADRLGSPFIIENAGPELTQRIGTLGLAALLQLPAEVESE